MIPEIVRFVINQFQLIPMKNIFLVMFNNVQEKYLKNRRLVNKEKQLNFSIFKREQFAAVAAIANHHRFPPPPPSSSTTVDDPDVNVVDLDDGIEREEKSCQESFNSDQTYSPSLYTKSSNVQELDPPKCVVCM
jgi:hypothetical protein